MDQESSDIFKKNNIFSIFNKNSICLVSLARLACYGHHVQQEKHLFSIQANQHLFSIFSKIIMLCSAFSACFFQHVQQVNSWVIYDSLSRGLQPGFLLQISLDSPPRLGEGGRGEGGGRGTAGGHDVLCLSFLLLFRQNTNSPPHCAENNNSEIKGTQFQFHVREFFPILSGK